MAVEGVGRDVFGDGFGRGAPRARALWTAIADDPTYLAQIEPILDGMRKAGVPEE